MSDPKRQIWLESGGHVRITPELRGKILGLVAVYVLFAIVFDARLWQPGRALTPGLNVQVAEAKAWLGGSLSLPKRSWDTALYEGRVYSHFPPAMTFLATTVLPWSPRGVPFHLLAILFVLPIPALAYLLFLRRCESVVAAVVMTCLYVLGTSELAVMRRTMQSGMVWQLNHAITQLGLLVFLLDYFGRRRVWLGGLGVLVACLARFTLAVYLLPLLWLAVWRKRPQKSSGLLMVGGVTLFALGVPLALNALKFGHPLRPGYPLVYEGRDDLLSRDAEIGLFSVRFIPRNLYTMNVGPPRFKEFRGGRRLVPNDDQTGIWWTTPLLLYLLLDGGRIWRNANVRPLLLAVAIVFAALMMYHATGAAQHGYNRYSLDFMLPLLAMLAPFAMTGRRRFLTPLMVVWSVYYFGWWIA